MRRLLSFLIFLATGVVVRAQQAEQGFLPELQRLVDSITTLSISKPSGTNYERLMAANNRLHDWLIKEGAKHPEWLTIGDSSFEVNGVVGVLTSSDRRFRIYWWDTQTGGTMHFYSAVAQYQTAPGKVATMSLTKTKKDEEGEDPGYWYSSLNTVKTKSGKTFYLPIYHGTYSTHDLSSGIRAYTIQDGKLRNDVPLFFTKTKQYAEISYNYDFFAEHEAVDGDGSYADIDLSADGKELTIPIVTEKGLVTNRALIYRFDGERFVYMPRK